MRCGGDSPGESKKGAPMRNVPKFGCISRIGAGRHDGPRRRLVLHRHPLFASGFRQFCRHAGHCRHRALQTYGFGGGTNAAGAVEWRLSSTRLSAVESPSWATTRVAAVHCKCRSTPPTVFRSLGRRGCWERVWPGCWQCAAARYEEGNDSRLRSRQARISN